MSIKVEYSELMNSITEGIMRHNQKEIAAMLLIKGTITPCEWEQREEKIRFSLQQTAYNVLVELKKQLGSQIEISENGSLLLTEYDENL